MAIKWVNEIPLEGKRVFCRVDFNVPLDEKRQVRDDTRIRAALPTIQHILKTGGKPILASHLGRPKGHDPALSMVPIGEKLAELLGGEFRVLVTDEPGGDGARKVVADMREHDVVLLENVRFIPGETKNNEDFAKDLAALADGYAFVNDAFGSAHRAHSSTTGVAQHVKYKAAGFLMKKELEFLGKLLGTVDRPYIAILGGAKVKDKIGVLENMLNRVNALIIGGAMANTFLKVQGGDMGASKIDDESLESAKNILEAAKKKNVEIILPQDVVAANALEAEQGTTAPAMKVPAGLMALDIGPESRKLFREKILQAKTIFWNGPMGVFEKAPFAQGTMAMAQAVAETQALSVVGGGDSVSAIKKSGFADKISHISTGGGASLEFVEGKTLPGVAALEV